MEEQTKQSLLAAGLIVPKEEIVEDVEVTFESEEENKEYIVPKEELSDSSNHPEEDYEHNVVPVKTEQTLTKETSQTETEHEEASEYIEIKMPTELRELFQNGCGSGGVSFIDRLEFTSPEDFSAVVRCRIPASDTTLDDCKHFVDSFIQKYSIITKSNWIVRKNFPTTKTLLYRKKYTCQRSSFNKRNPNEMQRRTERNQNCNAIVDVSVWYLNEKSKKGLNVMINIDHKHTHSMAGTYSLSNWQPKSHASFDEYFQNGMTPITARLYHETKLMEQYKSNIAEVLANAQLNPTERQLRYLHNKWRNTNKKCRSYEEIINSIKQKYPQHTIINQSDSLVVVVTRIMARVLKTVRCERLFVENSTLCDSKSSSIAIFFADSKIGALPIACAIYTQREVNHTLVFSAVKEALGSIDVNFNPGLILTDDKIDERNVLSVIFPKSRLMLSGFHMCQGFWRWLCDFKHNINSDKRHFVMTAFRRILYAENVQLAEKYYKELISNDYVSSKRHLLEHLIKLWLTRTEWATAYRDKVTLGHINNVTESNIRICKEILVQRCKGFNILALSEFICDIFENYLRQRILEISNCSRSKNDYMKFLTKGNITEVYNINENEFRVKSETKSNVFYTVRLDTGFCNCELGKSGAFCKHLCSIEEKHGSENPLKLSQDERFFLVKLATGNKFDISSYKDFMTEENNPLLTMDYGMMNEINIEAANTIDEPDTKNMSCTSDPKPGISEEHHASAGIKTEPCSLEDYDQMIFNATTVEKSDVETMYTTDTKLSIPGISQKHHLTARIKTEPLSLEDYDQMTFNATNVGKSDVETMYTTADTKLSNTLIPGEIETEYYSIGDYQNALGDLNREFARLSKMFGDNPSSWNLKAMRTLISYMRDINTKSEAQGFIFQDIQRGEKCEKSLRGLVKNETHTQEPGRENRKRQHSLISDINCDVSNKN